MSQRVIRIAEIASTKDKKGILPVSPATVWRWVREGKFPAPFKLGDSITVWSADQIEAFIAQRAGGAAQLSKASKAD
jgi:prophage regulatory protein